MGGIGNNHGSVDDRLPGRTVEQFILTATKHALQFRGAFGFLIFVLQVLLGHVEPLGPLEQLRRNVDSGNDEERARHGETCDNERSEEHTSELQSLMRISYAVFCLKK